MLSFRPWLGSIAGLMLVTTGAVAASSSATITIDMTPAATISPLLYGADYEWNLVSAASFHDWSEAMPALASAPTRYPSGWNAEHYTWGQNQETAWQVTKQNCYTPVPSQSCANDIAGAGPGKLLGSVSVPSFIVPSALYVKNPTSENLQALVTQSAGLARHFGDQVRIWEIGNEWWLQGSQDSRAARLTAYSQLVAAVAPQMKAANANILIYADADWLNPQEVATIRGNVGAKAWKAIDGISIHAYCSGDTSLDDSRPACSDLSAVAAQIRSESGKDLLFDSEWNASQMQSIKYIVNAYMTVFGVEAMAMAGIQGAAYWPTAYIEPEVSLIDSSDGATPTGTLYSWLAQYYQGQALSTHGKLPAIAALADDGKVTLFVPTQDTGPIEIKIPLKGTGLSRVVSAEVLYTAKPNSPNPETADLPIAIKTGGGKHVDFVLNPGTKDRGKSWEIARVTLSR
jgi:hypothetical protein